jgi:para-aminobenzoate synthetase component 1
MPRHHFKISRPVAAQWQKRLLAHSKAQEYFLLLNSNGHTSKYSRYEWLCGWGASAVVNPLQNSFNQLYSFQQKHQDWLLGHLNFNLKNELEALHTKEADAFDYPNLSFFVPQNIVYQKQGVLHCESDLYQNQSQLDAALPEKLSFSKPSLPAFKSTLSEEEYLEKITRLKEHLQYGSIYEINFCQELLGHGSLAGPEVFWHLNQVHAAPFAAFYQLGKRQLLCFSPERYLQKNGVELISQPIKGTAKRGGSAADDAALLEQLKASEKERAENVMIVDLVRNDLSRTAEPGSVSVPELFKVYSYPAVHQMVSTVRSKLAHNFHFSDALATTFPMGSMTGAPKISALRLIEKYENFNRSLYSGSVGYITPNGDFDFNVIIRSILHHQKKQLSSVRVGSAITIHCQAKKEYEECLLKAEKVIKIA